MKECQISQFLFLTELKLHYMFFFQIFSAQNACFCYTFSAQYSPLVTRGGSDGIILRPSNGPGVEQWHRVTMIHSPTHLVSANTETQGVGDQGWGGNQIFKNKSPLSSFHLPGFLMISISAQSTKILMMWDVVLLIVYHLSHHQDARDPREATLAFWNHPVNGVIVRQIGLRA